MTEQEKEMFAKLISDNMSLQADVTILKGLLINHFEQFYKDKGMAFSAVVFEEGYSKQRRELYEQIFLQYPIISDELSRMIRNGLGL